MALTYMSVPLIAGFFQTWQDWLFFGIAILLITVVIEEMIARVFPDDWRRLDQQANGVSVNRSDSQKWRARLLVVALFLFIALMVLVPISFAL